jgi:hypothetical protein
VRGGKESSSCRCWLSIYRSFFFIVAYLSINVPIWPGLPLPTVPKLPLREGGMVGEADTPGETGNPLGLLLNVHPVGGRNVNSSLQLSGSLYINFGGACFCFSLLKRIKAAQSARPRGRPSPQPNPAMSPDVYIFVVPFTAAVLAGHDMFDAFAVEPFDEVTSTTEPRSEAICVGRSTRPVPLLIVNVEVFVVHCVLLSPQTNVADREELVHGVMAIAEEGFCIAKTGQFGPITQPSFQHYIPIHRTSKLFNISDIARVTRTSVVQNCAHSELPQVLSVHELLDTIPSAKHNPFCIHSASAPQHADWLAVALQGKSSDIVWSGK